MNGKGFAAFRYVCGMSRLDRWFYCNDDGCEQCEDYRAFWLRRFRRLNKR